MASKKFLRAWVKALRSGKYKQARIALMVPKSKGVDYTGYCCLGVACSVQARITGKPAKRFTSSGRGLRYEALAGEWLLPEGDQWELAHRNDDHTSFSDIADYIEKKYIKNT